MSTPISKIRSSLEKKGFLEIEGGRHKKLFFYHDGKRTSSHLILSRSPKMKEFDDSLLAYAKGELKLRTNAEVKELWNCPMSQAKFVEKLKEYGVI